MNERDLHHIPASPSNPDPVRSLCGKIAHQLNLEKGFRRQAERAKTPQQRERLEFEARVAQERATLYRETLALLREQLTDLQGRQNRATAQKTDVWPFPLGQRPKTSPRPGELPSRARNEKASTILSG